MLEEGKKKERNDLYKYVIFSPGPITFLSSYLVSPSIEAPPTPALTQKLLGSRTSPALDVNMTCMCRNDTGIFFGSRSASENTLWKCVAMTTFGQAEPRFRR